MIITIATKQKVNENSRKYITANADDLMYELYGISRHETIFVTEIGPALENDIEDEKSVAHLKPVYFSYSTKQVVEMLGLEDRICIHQTKTA